ncbi:hypothetical protein [Spirosoma fluminis]
MARALVPELEDYAQYSILATIAKERRLTNEAALQLALDDAMQTLAYLHHQRRYQQELHQLHQKPNG